MNTTVPSSRPISVYLLAAVLVLQSIGALICGALLMGDPSGGLLQFPPDTLDHAPFPNFFVPGFFLFTCLGVLPLFAVYELMTRTDTRVFRRFNLYRNYRFGWMLALFSGFGTLIWITAQQYFTQMLHWLQTFYAAVGMLILILALLPTTMAYCRETVGRPGE